MDLKVFFDTIKKSRFNGRLTDAQVKGMEAIIAGWERWGYGLDTGMAYTLATPFHETGKRMQPVRETFATSTKQAIARLDAAYAKGQMKWVRKPYWRGGWFGRGLAQVTHEENYNGDLRDAVLREFGVDIHKDPDAVLRLDISVFMLIEGASKGVTLKADYTTSALEDFINDTKTDYHNARKTINPAEKDSYGPIAAIAEDFEAAIRAARAADGEEFKGPSGRNLYDGKFHDEVYSVQKTLAGKKYQVGEIDGKWGSLTSSAVMLFREKNGLPPKVNITDQDFLAALVTAGDLTLSGERTQTTVADLRAKGSETIKTADKVDWTGRVMAGGAGLAAVDKGLDQAEKYSDYAQRAKALIDPVTSIMQDHFWVILGGLAAVIIFQAFKQKRIAAEKYQTGETIKA